LPRSIYTYIHTYTHTQVSGYTADDKLHIAKKHLMPTARAESGLKSNQITVTDVALRTLITKYCREPGVRNLQKQIEKLMRKVRLVHTHA